MNAGHGHPLRFVILSEPAAGESKDLRFHEGLKTFATNRRSLRSTSYPVRRKIGAWRGPRSALGRDDKVNI